MVVHRAICGALGVRPLETLETRPFVEFERALDLGSKFSPPRKELVREHRILQNARRVGANSLVEEAEARAGRGIGGLLSGSQVRYVNDSIEAHGARIVLFGDS